MIWPMKSAPKFLWVLLFSCGALLEGAEPTRLERNNLLIYRDAAGEIRPVKSVADWQKRRAEILRGMEEVMGPLPGKEQQGPLDLKVEEEIDCGSYLRRLISYTSEPGSRVPAYLLVPKKLLEEKTTAPAILCLHPTDKDLGHKVVVGLGGKANRAYAAELAERGFVTLAPAYPLLANYNPDLKLLGYSSGTMKAVHDNRRGLNLLETFPFVKKGRFGAIGHSLGGHNAIYTAVFDERIRIIVSSCGFDSYLDYMNRKIAGWTSDRYMPKLRSYDLEKIPFDFHEMIGALAPRKVFVNAPIGDTNFKWQSVDAVVKAAGQIYRLYGVPENLRVTHPDCGHDFPDEIRREAYAVFEQLR